MHRTPSIPAAVSIVGAAARRPGKILAALICATFAGGCATTQGDKNFLQETFASDDPCANNARNIGIVGGAIVGGIVGNQIKHSNLSRTIGMAAGAALGGLIGADIDRRRCELSKIAKANGLDMLVEKIETPPSPSPNQTEASRTSTQTVGLRVAIRDNERQFRSGSAELTPEAESYFRQIADQYSFTQQKRGLSPKAAQNDRETVDSLKSKRILLVGHTDDIGNSHANADLSERRAQAVAKVFLERGISAEQLFFQGAGETLPIADNRDEAGRARNRRVEIIDLSDDEAFRTYLRSRTPNLAYYRPTAPTAKSQPTPAAGNEKPSIGTPAESKRPTSETGKAKSVSAAPVAGAGNAPTTIGGTLPTTSGNPSANPAALDFGGHPVGSSPPAVDIGKLSVSRSFSIISNANADEPFIGNCTHDRPRIGHGVKSMKDGKEYATSDYLPGVYDSSWAAQVNGHLVALTHVAVLRDGGAPARKPTLLVYRNYTGEVTAKPSHSDAPEVNTYQGDKALLYRVFNSGPIRCMDVVIPNDNPREAPRSALFYERSGALYTVAFNPKLAK
ncbi:MAG: OmpA family protein [Rhodocyclales bacterium]|nr:OmpA family protein [Rhodocyclales bacterium]